MKNEGIVNWNDWGNIQKQEGPPITATYPIENPTTENLIEANPKVIYHLGFFAPENRKIWIRFWEKKLTEDDSQKWKWKIEQIELGASNKIELNNVLIESIAEADDSSAAWGENALLDMKIIDIASILNSEKNETALDFFNSILNEEE
jgi:hypothetical protein